MIDACDVSKVCSLMLKMSELKSMILLISSLNSVNCALELIPPVLMCKNRSVPSGGGGRVV